MAFKIKDLMINVLPSDATFCPDNTELCVPTEKTTTLFWTCFFSIFKCGASDTWFNHLPTDDLYGASPTRSSAALAALKEQLKRQLAAVEKQQTAVEESMNPKTVEEVDMLTAKLTEALEELKARRAELAKKPKPRRKK